MLLSIEDEQSYFWLEGEVISLQLRPLGIMAWASPLQWEFLSYLSKQQFWGGD